MRQLALKMKTVSLLLGCFAFCRLIQRHHRGGEGLRLFLKNEFQKLSSVIFQRNLQTAVDINTKLGVGVITCALTLALIGVG